MDARDDVAEALCHFRTLSSFFLTPTLQSWASRVGLGNEIKTLNDEITRTRNFLFATERKQTQSILSARILRSLRRLIHEAEYFLGKPGAGRPSYDLQIKDESLQEMLDISPTIQRIVKQSRVIVDAMHEGLEFAGVQGHLDYSCDWGYWSTLPSPNPAAHDTVCELFGRDWEAGQILMLLTEGFSGRDLSGLALAGPGGIGKTALAKHIYGHPRVADHFNLRRWISLPFSFDPVYIAREMLDCIASNRYEGIKSLDRLLHILTDHLKRNYLKRRLLFVLDDVWEDNPDIWHKLLAPLKDNMQTKGNVLLITTRSKTAASVISTAAPFFLLCLEEDVFCDLFNYHVLDGHPRTKYDKNEAIIAQQIAGKLEGIPLVARVGASLLRKLRCNLHWRIVLLSLQSIELKRRAVYTIPKILYLNYACLPFRLQQCFAYCSLFPRRHKFDGEDLVYLWMAQGFLYSTDSNKRMEEIGSEYLNVLIDSAFFEKGDALGKAYYYVHDRIYDLAKAVSSYECLSIPGDFPSGCVSETTRHLSIINELVYKWGEDNKGLLSNTNFEKILFKVMRTLHDRTLKTLILTGQYNSNFLTMFQNFVQEMTRASGLRSLSGLCRLRVLRLSTMSFDFDFLFRNVAGLRYLKLESNENDIPLPESLWQIPSLLVLDISGCRGLATLPKEITNLINLRHFLAEKRLHSMLFEVGKLTFLQELQEFRARRLSGFEIAQLRSLRELGGLLSISGLETVENKVEASEAALVHKQRLSKLHLSWDSRKSMKSNSKSTAEAEVLEGLQPHDNLQELSIIGYGGSTSPEWLQINLPLRSLVSLHLEDCRAWEVLPPLGQLPCLKKLHMVHMPVVKEVGVQFYGSSEMQGFMSLEELEFSKMAGLEKWVGNTNSQLFPRLESLKIADCPKLIELPFTSSPQTTTKNFFPRLRTFIIQGCPDVMESFF